MDSRGSITTSRNDVCAEVPTGSSAIPLSISKLFSGTEETFLIKSGVYDVAIVLFRDQFAGYALKSLTL